MTYTSSVVTKDGTPATSGCDGCTTSMRAGAILGCARNRLPSSAVNPGITSGVRNSRGPPATGGSIAELVACRPSSRMPDRTASVMTPASSSDGRTSHV